MKNIKKLNINIKRIRKANKSLKISIHYLKIETKKKTYNIINKKKLIFIFQVFYIYIQISDFFAIISNKQKL